jgi:hypothetical protein
MNVLELLRLSHGIFRKVAAESSDHSPESSCQFCQLPDFIR